MPGPAAGLAAAAAEGVIEGEEVTSAPALLMQVHWIESPASPVSASAASPTQGSADVGAAAARTLRYRKREPGEEYATVLRPLLQGEAGVGWAVLYAAAEDGQVLLDLEPGEYWLHCAEDVRLTLLHTAAAS